MNLLSNRTKNAIKPALGVVIAYSISLGMGWKNPYWAGFAVAMISLSTAGQSLNKGAMRMMGTLAAAAAVLILIAWFAQDRWWFITVLSVYIGFCTYMIAGDEHQYFWYCSAFIVLVIGVHSTGDLPNAFNVTVLRTQQTGMGIVVYTLISVFLWPTNTRGMLKETVRKLIATQAAIFRNYCAIIVGQGTPKDSRSLRMQEVQLLSQCEQILRAAEADSYEVWEVRHLWWHLHHLSAAMTEALERWRESFSGIQPLASNALLPNLEAVCTELDQRFEEIEHMLTDKSTVHTPQVVSLAIDSATMHSITHFQKATVAVVKAQLDRLEKISRALFDCVCDIKGGGRQSAKAVEQDTRSGGFGPDPDRLQAALRAMATLWVAFLIWFYIDPPGHSGFVQLATIFTIGAVMLNLSPTIFLKPFIVLTLAAGALYIFVMPHLSGYAQLAMLIFGTIFAIYYVFWQPRQGLAKSIGAVMFLNVIAVQNQQTYNFASYANTVVSIALTWGLAVIIWYLPPSPYPEKVFLRLLSRFYRHSEFMMSRMYPDCEQTRGWAERWKTMVFHNDLMKLPQKLAALGGQIDHRLFPRATTEQIQGFVNSLQALALRLKDLADVRRYPQSALLVQELLDDMRAWRRTIEELFQNWSEHPASEADCDLQNRLAEKLKEMENRINQTLDLAEQTELSEEDYKNFYQLIGRYRGLSGTIVEHAKRAGSFDWTGWKEERF
jgi:uncharacterized membrane protein YccC